MQKFFSHNMKSSMEFESKCVSKAIRQTSLSFFHSVFASRYEHFTKERELFFFSSVWRAQAPRRELDRIQANALGSASLLRNKTSKAPATALGPRKGDHIELSM